MLLGRLLSAFEGLTSFFSDYANLSPGSLFSIGLGVRRTAVAVS